MSEAGHKSVESLGEWEDLGPITLSRWQVRMVLQALASTYDDYHQKRPSRMLPAIAGIVNDEIVALLQATINDVAIQAGIVRAADVSVVLPTTALVPHEAKS